MAGDVDYDDIGATYSRTRRTDPRIAACVHAAVGSARTILNVGAGAGSYEPTDRFVIAIEPSATMRSQRPPHLIPAINAVAEDLPLDDQSVDAAMAMLTVHQWRDLERGLDELCRVTRGPIVVLTFDGDALDHFWLAEYASELIEAERSRYPAINAIKGSLGTAATVQAIPIPIDCVDGFTEAYYARPDVFLDPKVRQSQSGWSFVDDDTQQRIIEALHDDIESGKWDQKYGKYRKQPQFEGSLRLIVSDPTGRVRGG